MRKSMIILFALGLATASAVAQTDDKDPRDCMARPQEKSQAPTQNGSAEKGDAGSLSEKLDPCNGVLQPPPVGDGEITAVPPDTGTTPVIRPGDIEPQAPREN